MVDSIGDLKSKIPVAKKKRQALIFRKNSFFLFGRIDIKCLLLSDRPLYNSSTGSPPVLCRSSSKFPKYKVFTLCLCLPNVTIK